LIERALAMGIPIRIIAERYHFSEYSIARYRERMPQQLKAAIIAATLKPDSAEDLEKLKADEAAGLLGNLAAQRARLLIMQDNCMDHGAVEPMVRLSNVIHRNLSMVGHYLGLFANINVNQNVNILVSEDYLQLRHALTTALHPFPEARRAVADALHRVEGDVARKMLAAAGKPVEVIEQVSPQIAAAAPWKRKVGGRPKVPEPAILAPVRPLMRRGDGL
jgi:hypothetical protein